MFIVAGVLDCCGVTTSIDSPWHCWSKILFCIFIISRFHGLLVCVSSSGRLLLRVLHHIGWYFKSFLCRSRKNWVSQWEESNEMTRRRSELLREGSSTPKIHFSFLESLKRYFMQFWHDSWLPFISFLLKCPHYMAEWFLSLPSANSKSA